ncbi:MAG: LptE family protein [Salinibacter sp.]
MSVLLLLVGSVSLSGCAFYSFSGASIPSHLETIAVPIAQDNTSNPLPSMGATLTDLLTDRFVDRTSLSLTTDDAAADAVLTARIQKYTNQPTGVSGDERATTNQITIRVQVRYVDQTKGKEMLNQTFSGSASYDPVEAGLSGERQAARNALQNVADNIFSTATSNW